MMYNFNSSTRASRIEKYTLLKYFRLLTILCLLFAGGVKVKAQSNDEVYNQFWFDLYSHFYINKKLEYYGDAGYRTIFHDDKWHRLYVRPSVRYHRNTLWELHAGLGIFYIYNTSKNDRFDLRPWQAIRFNIPTWKHISLKNTIRLEERFAFFLHENNSSVDILLRYKWSGKVKLCKVCFEQYWYIPMNGELFFAIVGQENKFFRNESRYGIGVGYSLSYDWRFELLYNWQRQRSIPDESLILTDNSVQIKIFRLWDNRTGD